MKKIVGYVLILAVLVGAQQVFTALHPAAHGPDMSQGVHVCVPRDYNSHQLLCIRDAHTLTARQADAALLSFTGPGGAQFQGSSATIIVSTSSAHGGWTEEGRWTQPAALANTVMAGNLAHAMIQAGAAMRAHPFVAPLPGSYQVEVDNGSTVLGTATFTVR